MEPLKVLVVHESYRQPGGEDLSVAADVDLLRAHGHEIFEYRRHNRDVADYGTSRLGLGTVWSRSSYREIKTLVSAERPAIVHFHNTLPLISPSGLWAARRAGARVVQTLRNYRLVCPNALLYRRGTVCQECLHWPVPLPGVLHGCYRESRLATAAVAAMLAAHRSIGTWHRAVDVFVALTQFQKAKLLAGGVPESRMIIRPNFLSSDPGPGPGDGGYALFAGRLTREKGVLTLLEAWARLPMPVPLRIVGSGPLVEEVRRAAATNRAVSYLGPQPHGRVLELLQRAACLVFPSEWYESFGRIVLEALAVGTPVAAASGGAAEELVRDGSTGALFRPGDPEGLAVAVSRIVQNGEADGAMRTACRREYLEKYTAERAYERLIEIYRMATGHRPDKTE